MGNRNVIAFQFSYPPLTRRLKETNPESYYFNIFGAILMQGEKGFKHVKIGKATTKGTKITYKRIASEKRAEDIKASLIAMAQEFNEKYNTGIKIEEEK